MTMLVLVMLLLRFVAELRIVRHPKQAAQGSRIAIPLPCDQALLQRLGCFLAG
jgi:hypothetical protein